MPTKREDLFTKEEMNKIIQEIQRNIYNRKVLQKIIQDIYNLGYKSSYDPVEPKSKYNGDVYL